MIRARPIIRPPCPCHDRPEPGSVDGWHARRGPLPVLSARHRLPSYGRPGWVDHAYRLRLADGRWRYVAEPYSLGEDALEDLAYLVAHGWTVSVTAWRARHNPGRAVAVEIVEQREAPPRGDKEEATV